MRHYPIDEQERRLAGDQSAKRPSDQPERFDLGELTAAVERLLRRDLEIARERGRGKRRRSGWR
jgi:hypothetical protein